ncbi:MAG TPA: metallophosphoesterase [Pyrinomonadaceae bacterium]|nr:metallophosphoesterase [Pyrinomonadaceae bacterium]
MNKLNWSRRQFLTGLAGAPLFAISATAAYSRFIEPYYYRIAEQDVFIRDLPEAFENFRITQITDVHHSRIVGLDEVQRVVKLAQATNPDLIALTGDYTTTYRHFIEPCAESLGALKAPEGVWAVLGNHDHYTDNELTTRALERNHIAVLNNANTKLTRRSEKLQLAGIDDWSWAKTDWKRAFYGLDQNQPAVLLSHQPGVLEVAETQNVSLILSGHTHGGQVTFPFIGAPARLATKDLKYAHGLFRRSQTQLYVSSGTGVIGLPVRLGIRPEIAVLRLRRELRST